MVLAGKAQGQARPSGVTSTFLASFQPHPHPHPHHPHPHPHPKLSTKLEAVAPSTRECRRQWMGQRVDRVRAAPFDSDNSQRPPLLLTLTLTHTPAPPYADSHPYPRPPR